MSAAMIDARSELTTHAQDVVTGAQIDRFRAVVRSALAAHVDGTPADAGTTASPLHPFVLAWSTFDSAVSTLTGLREPTVLHLNQEIRQRHPLPGDEPVTLDLEVMGTRRDPTGTRISFRSTLNDAQGQPFADLVTVLLALGATRPEPFGEQHRYPVSTPRGWEVTVDAVIPESMPRRYAEVSADWNPIHLDEAAARSAGLSGVIAHGMSVVGLVTEEAIDRFAGGDAARIAGVGTRFSSPVIPGERFEIAFDPAPGRIHFQCRTARGLALKNGWIDVRP